MLSINTHATCGRRVPFLDCSAVLLVLALPPKAHKKQAVMQNLEEEFKRMAEIIAEAPDRKLCFLVPAILVSCSLNSLFRRGLSVEISLDREGYPLGFGQIIAASGIIAENRTFSASTGRVLVPGCGGVSAIPLGLSDADSFST